MMMSPVYPLVINVFEPLMIQLSPSGDRGGLECREISSARPPSHTNSGDLLASGEVWQQAGLQFGSAEVNEVRAQMSKWICMDEFNPMLTFANSSAKTMLNR